MSTEQDQARALAERIAARLARTPEPAPAEHAPDVGRELAALRHSLGEVQQRLAQIESHVAHTDDCGHEDSAVGMSAQPSHTTTNAARTTQPPQQHWTSSTYIPVVPHPSQERFGIDEAVSELVDFFEREKVCTVEPGGKPCDHCAMCSSRGF